MSALLEERARRIRHAPGGPGGKASSLRRLPCAAAICVLAAFPLHAQQAASPLPAGRAQTPAVQSVPAAPPVQTETGPEAAPQPGQSAQVRTGTASGLTANTRLLNLLADHQFLVLRDQLGKMPPQEAQFYRGILANRDNDAKKSIALLEPLVDKVTASGNVEQEKVLRKALAEDYLRLGAWAKAAEAYQTLESRLKSKLTPDEEDEIEMPLKLLPLAAANPPMTVEPCDPFQLQVSRDPLGLTDIPVFVDAQPQTFMLDPTAPFNLISSSIAKEVGLKVSDQFATIRTLTGKPIKVRVTVIPRFTIGGRLELRNMTVFVFDDADYFFPRTQYQVEGVLGYPALQALGSLTITADSTIEVRPAKQILPPEKDDLLKRGAPFFLDGDEIIVALGGHGAPDGTAAADPDGRGARMFVVDASGQQTYLTARYYDEYSAQFAGQQMQLFSIPGSDSLPPQPAYMAETIPLTVGRTTVKVHYIQVLTEPLGNAALDDVYGVLGVDALDQLKSYTFDYRTMRFSVRPE